MPGASNAIASLYVRVGADTGDLDKGVRRASATIKGLKNEINTIKASTEVDRLRSQLEKLKTPTVAATTETKSLAAQILTLNNVARFAGVAVGLTALGGLAAMMGQLGQSMVGVVSSGIRMNATLETARLQFTTLLGSASAASKHIKDVFRIAAETPFESGDIIAGSRALQTMGGSALNTRANLLLVGDAAAATSATFQEVSFWVGRAYNSIQSGRPFGEASNRLQELGILSGDTRNKLEALSESGAASSQVWAMFAGDLAKFTGAMVRQSTTFEGMVSTLKDNIAILAAGGTEELFEALKTGVEGLNKTLSDPATIQGIKDFAAGLRTIGDTGIWVADQLTKINIQPLLAAATELARLRKEQAQHEKLIEQGIAPKPGVNMGGILTPDFTDRGLQFKTPTAAETGTPMEQAERRLDALIRSRHEAARETAMQIQAEDRLRAAHDAVQDSQITLIAGTEKLAQTKEQAARAVDKEALAHAKWEKQAKATQQLVDSIRGSLASAMPGDREGLAKQLEEAFGSGLIKIALHELDTDAQSASDAVKILSDNLAENAKRAQEVASANQAAFDSIKGAIAGADPKELAGITAALRGMFGGTAVDTAVKELAGSIEHVTSSAIKNMLATRDLSAAFGALGTTNIPALGSAMSQLTTAEDRQKGATDRLTESKRALDAVNRQLAASNLTLQSQQIGVDRNLLPLQQRRLELERQLTQLGPADPKERKQLGMAGPQNKARTKEIDDEIAKIDQKLALLNNEKSLNDVISRQKDLDNQSASVQMQQQVLLREQEVSAAAELVSAMKQLVEVLKPILSFQDQMLAKLVEWGILTSAQADLIKASGKGLAGAGGQPTTATGTASESAQAIVARLTHKAQRTPEEQKQLQDAVNAGGLIGQGRGGSSIVVNVTNQIGSIDGSNKDEVLGRLERDTPAAIKRVLSGARQGLF